MTEAGARELLQRLGPPKPSSIPQECKSGLGFTTVVGPVLITLGEQISSFATAILAGTPAFPIRQVEDKPTPLPRLMLKSLLPMLADCLEDWVEETIEEIQDVCIQFVQPAKRRMVLSVALSMEVCIHGYTEGDDVHRRYHRWTMSDLFPEASGDEYENDNNIPMAQRATLRRPLSDAYSDYAVPNA